MTGVKEIRKTFLDHFADDHHQIVPSSPLVPLNDPTLMFVNSGMVQFKNVFIGAEQRPYQRATTTQKCVRAGGKHNDLDNVGYTARHHTFFEMLGNFSFGDYFKDHAIEMAWNLITQVYDLPKDKLLATVFAEDDEAYNLWKKIAGLPESRIIRINSSDNFWSMGDTGPCGPCSELFYDHGEHIPGGPPGSPDEDGDRFIEIWNLVFMQYEQVSASERVNLPKPSIDTGMGLERLAAVLQGKHDNYDIDLMQSLIGAIAEAAGSDPQGAGRVSHRVIADHLRAACFLVADGVLPSNEARGYVLRRIMRRAMRHAQLIGAKEPLMHRLVPTLIGEMGEAFPELLQAKSLMTETLYREEKRFRETLSRGLGILEDESRNLAEGDVFSGETAFKLYDTYGFPLDLTEDALRARGVTVGTADFDAAMAKQKAEARASWSGSGDQGEGRLWLELHDEVGATEFLGYDRETAEAVVAAMVVDGQKVDRIGQGGEGWMVLNQTCFYGESGGQLGDQGTADGDKIKIEVLDVKRQAGGSLFIHQVKVLEGELTEKIALRLQVDHARRQAIRRNHSATHLLHEALRLTLGDHIAQKGSMVAPEKLRFDFSHHQALTAEEIEKVTGLTNRMIVQNSPVVTRLMTPDEARSEGARALFGEKYGEEVRVVSMGHGEAETDKAFSMELCGGTHAERTGEIGWVSIAQEQAVGSGVRRIEALTGEAARHYFAERSQKLDELAGLLKTPPQQAAERLAQWMDDHKAQARELADLKRKFAMGGASESGSQASEKVGEFQLLAKIVADMGSKDLKSMADDGREQIGSGVVAIISREASGKATVVTAVTEDLTAQVSAVELVRLAAAEIGGKGGGGRPDLAQAGGPDGGGAEKALEAIRSRLQSL